MRTLQRLVLFCLLPPLCWMLASALTVAHSTGGLDGFAAIGWLIQSLFVVCLALPVGVWASVVLPLWEKRWKRIAVYGVSWWGMLAIYCVNTLRFGYLEYYDAARIPYELDGWEPMDPLSAVLFGVVATTLFFMALADHEKKLPPQYFLAILVHIAGIGLLKHAAPTCIRMALA